jgi:uncharacterized protein DUF6982
MAELNRVIAHHLDGRVVKGTTSDFFPNRLSFHLQPVEGGPTAEVRCKELKAIFFVKEFSGNPQRRDLRGFIAGPGETSQGKKMAVRFKDGELLCGYSLSYLPGRDGFFVFPADSGSNNLRIYVLAAGTLAVKAGSAADALVEKALAAREE